MTWQSNRLYPVIVWRLWSDISPAWRGNFVDGHVAVRWGFYWWTFDAWGGHVHLVNVRDILRCVPVRLFQYFYFSSFFVHFNKKKKKKIFYSAE